MIWADIYSERHRKEKNKRFVSNEKKEEFAMNKKVKGMSGMVARVMAVVMFMMSFAGIGSNHAVKAAEHVLQNPKAVHDSSMDAGQRVTYDTIFFGSYPQTEVKSTDPVYSKLRTASGWNYCGDIVLDGAKYRRLKKSEVSGHNRRYSLEAEKYDRQTGCFTIEKVDPGVGPDGCYHWEDDETYHYFRFEPIRWRVLDTDGSKALVLSDVAMEQQILLSSGQANSLEWFNRYKMQIWYSWDNSLMRSWLNSYGPSQNLYGVNCEADGQRSFYNVAFSSSEQGSILDTNLINNGWKTVNDEIGNRQVTNGGVNTTDKVFLLSVDDICGKYGFSGAFDYGDEAKTLGITDYALATGVFVDNKYWEKSYNTWSALWGLRTPADGSNDTYGGSGFVSIDENGEIKLFRVNGIIRGYGFYNYEGMAVRPALTLDLSSQNYTYAGTYCTDGTYCNAGGNALSEMDPAMTTTPVETQKPSVTAKPETTEMPAPTLKPTATPTIAPTVKPTIAPTIKPTITPTVKPSITPTVIPSATPVVPMATPTPSPVPGGDMENEDIKDTVISGVTYSVKGTSFVVSKVPNQKSVTTQKEICINGIMYKVTGFGKNLFRKHKKVREVHIDVTYIKKFGRHTFDGLMNCRILLRGDRKKVRKMLRLLRSYGI